MKILKKICFSLIFLIILFFIAEICFQIRKLFTEKKIASSGYATILVTESGLKLSASPHSLEYVISPSTIYKLFPNQKSQNFTINEFGFRGKKFEKSEKHFKRIILLGGSAAFGYFLNNDTETISEILENKLEPMKIQVINAGIPGFFSSQELHYLLDILDYEPDFIIQYSGWNDVHGQFYFDSKKDDLLGWSESFQTIENSLLELFHLKSSFISALGNIIDVVLNKSIIINKIEGHFARVLERKKISENKNQKDNAYLKKIAERYAENVIKMGLICSAKKIKFFSVFQPEIGHKKIMNDEEKQIFAKGMGKGKEYDKIFPPLYDDFIKRASDILSANKIKYFNMNESKQFIESPLTLFFDPVHTNFEGNKIIAEVIAKFFLEKIESEERNEKKL